MLDLPDWMTNAAMALGGTAGGGLVAAWAALRQDRRTQAASVNQLSDLVIKSSREQLEQVMRQVGRYEGELLTLRQARFALEDALVELRDSALAARTMVHELERALGRPETIFAPLPRPGLPAQAPPAA